MMKKGFTLVELSIVLVIIGLLIGGILVGQSLINAAKIQKFVRQMEQFDISVNNFYTKYKGLPGDSSSFGCINISNKCNNRIIEDINGNIGGYLNRFSGEPANFWTNLQQSGLITTGANLTSIITGTFKVTGLNQNSPKMSLGENTGIIPYWQDFAPLINYYAIANWSINSSDDLWHPVHPIASIAVYDAQAVDLKIDDGKPASGDILSYGAGGWAQNGTCFILNKYNTADSSDSCMILIRMQRLYQQSI